MPHLLLLLLAAAALAGCASVSVFGIVGDEDDLYTGSATGYLDRSGTIELKNAKGNRCSGDFAYGVGLTGRGLIACDDGQRAVISFTGLSSMSGFGSGTSSTGRQVAFTYGLSREQSARYLGFKATGATAAAPGAPPAAATRAGTGTGFHINRQGHVLTNAHVVAKCRELTVSRQGSAPTAASLVKADASNDLAVLIATPSPAVAAFRAGRPVRAGETVVAFGFPLTGMLSSGGIVTNGSVSALSGLGDDSRYLQISAPIQAGNSGGPLLDSSGNVVGIVTSSIRDSAVARRTGAIPQNINFALKADVARTFLEAAGVPIETSSGGRDLSVADIGEKARAFSVFIDCKR
ncbi:MAG: serine protease [Reyranella sp.]|nr:serine protease [Reyranella sp.]